MVCLSLTGRPWLPGSARDGWSTYYTIKQPSIGQILITRYHESICKVLGLRRLIPWIYTPWLPILFLPRRAFPLPTASPPPSLSVPVIIVSFSAMSSQFRPQRRVLTHVTAGHPTEPDTVENAPQNPLEQWTPPPPGHFRFHNNDSRQSEITLEVSMRDIIMHSKGSNLSLARRYSSESTHTANNDSRRTSEYGNEKGQKAPPPPPMPVGFWDDRLAKTRVDVLKGWLKTS